MRERGREVGVEGGGEIEDGPPNNAPFTHAHSPTRAHTHTGGSRVASHASFSQICVTFEEVSLSVSLCAVCSCPFLSLRTYPHAHASSHRAHGNRARDIQCSDLQSSDRQTCRAQIDSARIYASLACMPSMHALCRCIVRMSYMFRARKQWQEKGPHYLAEHRTSNRYIPTPAALDANA